MSCKFMWIYYNPGYCGFQKGFEDSGNVTSKLRSYKSWYVKGKVKSVHLTSAVLDAGFHHSDCEQCLLPGYESVFVPPDVAYMAHLRMNAKAPNGC